MVDWDRAAWRLLATGPADGFTNMAVDEALLRVHAQGGLAPTLRFYAWSPPALSLGYGQQVESDIELGRCRALGIDVVRRMTGGRAVLHDHEVTYSVVIREHDPRLSAGVLASYLTVSRALIRGLSYLGIEAALLPLRRFAPATPGPVSPVCFVTPSTYEVAVAGRKIIGSAQRRAQGVIMQHGSIPLSLDRDLLFSLLRSSTRAHLCAQDGREDRERMTSLQEAGGRQYDYTEVIAALSRGFAEVWEVELIPGQLTDEERRLSAHLRAAKYCSESWIWRH